MAPIISIEEARKIVGDDAAGMSDDEIVQTVSTLDLLAKEALEEARFKLRRKKDAKTLANLIYDIYQDEKRKQPVKNDKQTHS